MDIYLNGQLLPPDQARVGVTDAGFQHAVGLFETFQAYHGRVFRLQAHLDRLARSAVELGLARTLNTEPLAQAVAQVIAHNRIDRARLRLTLTPGSRSLLQRSPDAVKDTSGHAEKNSEGTEKTSPDVGRAEGTSGGALGTSGGGGASGGTVLIVPEAPTAYDPAYFEQGIQVVLYSQAANPFDPITGHKTLAYWARLRSLRQAAGVGAGEAIWLNITNHLASGAISNVWVVKDNVLSTPIAHGEEVDGALPAPVLPGVTRGVIVELAEAAGLEVQRRMISVEDLLEADEAFLTNAGWGVLPVTRVEKAQVGGGRVGPMTTRLREALLTLIDQETFAPPPPPRKLGSSEDRKSGNPETQKPGNRKP